MRASPFLSSLAALAASMWTVGAAAPALNTVQPTPRAPRRSTGQVSRNYAARAARSHAGKPAGYVKAY